MFKHTHPNFQKNLLDNAKYPLYYSITFCKSSDEIINRGISGFED